MRRLSTPAAIVAIVFVTITMCAAFYVMGSPAEQRLRRFDERRTADVNVLSEAIQLYWSRHQQLPASLDEVVRDQGGDVLRRDPVTQRPYEYRVDGAKDAKAYTLCAQFDRESRDDGGLSRTWAHGAGRHCFARAVRERDPSGVVPR
jgi:hypothetical protein